MDGGNPLSSNNPVSIIHGEQIKPDHVNYLSQFRYNSRDFNCLLLFALVLDLTLVVAKIDINFL